MREKTRAGRDQAEVNALEIENRSDQWLFLQAGDIVKGGKQDRTITDGPRAGAAFHAAADRSVLRRARPMDAKRAER